MNKTWPLLVVLVVGTGIIIAARTPAGERRMQEWLIGVPRGEEDGAAFTFSATIDPTGERPVLRTSDGERIELRWEDGEGPMAAKTQIPGHFGASATLRFLCSSTADGYTGCGGGAGVYLHLDNYGIGPQLWPEIHNGKLMVHARGWHETPLIDEWYELDDAFHDWEVTIDVDATVEESVSEHPIGEKTGVTHAKEMRGKDEWVMEEEQTVTVRVVTEQGAYQYTCTPDTPINISALLTVTLVSGGHYSATAGDHVRAEDVTWTECPIDASRLHKVLNPTCTGESWLGTKMEVIGSGSTIRLYAPDELHTAGFAWQGRIHAPREYSFSGLHVRDMDGADLNDLEIYCTGVQEYTDGAWATVKHTLAEWQSLTVRPTWGIYSWDEDPPPDGACRLLPDVAFYIDRASARSHKLEGF